MSWGILHVFLNVSDYKWQIDISCGFYQKIDILLIYFMVEIVYFYFRFILYIVFFLVNEARYEEKIRDWKFVFLVAKSKKINKKVRGVLFILNIIACGSNLHRPVYNKRSNSRYMLIGIFFLKWHNESASEVCTVVRKHPVYWKSLLKLTK